nr:MAG TPA: hypothetical protein [Bacteriophage sp.]
MLTAISALTLSIDTYGVATTYVGTDKNGVLNLTSNSPLEFDAINTDSEDSPQIILLFS